MTSRALRVAIVGSGPSGMYAAGHLLESPSGTFCGTGLTRRVNRPIEVDVLDRLPTPWGLIRGGVAPDHPDKKKMARVYDTIARRPGFRFLGNVTIGGSIVPADLSAWYDAVIYAIGADGERELGIPGDTLAGCASARRFVGWYNGHPDFRDQAFDLSGERAVVIGNGNVSMDVARILLKPVDELRRTDIAAHALEALSRSRIREVVILGRRGPAEAAYNFPELEELGELPDTAIHVEGADLSAVRIHECSEGARKLDILRHLSRARPDGSRRVVLRFHAKPTQILGDDAVEGVRLEGGEVLSTMLVLAAIGYRGCRIEGLPFNDSSGTIPSDAGRVLQGSDVVQGIYVTGWIRRGPRGIIGTNKKCARDCVGSLLDDANQGRLSSQSKLGAEEVLEEIRARAPDVTNYAGWQRIDQSERRAGAAVDRPRLKFTCLEEMLLHASRPEDAGRPTDPIST